MPVGSNRRVCKRFEIPGAEGKFKKSGLMVFMKGFSEPCQVLNVSKGGLAFLCDKRFEKNEKVVVQLIAPGEEPMSFNSIVRRQSSYQLSDALFTGVEFTPFGKSRGSNPKEYLNVLRRLDKKYGESE